MWQRPSINPSGGQTSTSVPTSVPASDGSPSITHAMSTIPLVNLEAFLSHGVENGEAQRKAASALCDACSQFGFANVVGHGVPQELIEEAFRWSQRLFDLPLEEKMKAPHPPTPIPHRGYSKPSAEKVYSRDELENIEREGGGEADTRKIKDFKESYEIGSQSNPVQPNIWLPEETLPGYRAFMMQLYWELEKSARLILRALTVGLGLSVSERSSFLSMHSGNNNQLRLLHYPPIELGRLQNHEIERMPAHQDWSSFTLDFQDSTGGLEMRCPGADGKFIASKPIPGACVLNVGDMLERATNGHFTSALHRVGLPPLSDATVTEARYSIPYFVAPDDAAVVDSFPSLVSAHRPKKFEPVQFATYGEWLSKHMYTNAEGQ